MKTAPLLGLLTALVQMPIQAQNLVLNPSFEELDTCPDDFGMLNNATGWVSSRSSPDYLHACAYGNAQCAVPRFSTGFQYAATGNAFAGFLTYGSFAPNPVPQTREYGTGTLSQPLVIGTEYFVSFKASGMDGAPYASDNLGIKFITTPSLDFPISNAAQVYTSTVLTDTADWTLISGSFIADSAYTHLVIGNHFIDLVTEIVTMIPDAEGSHAYYIVDDVCVSANAAECDVSPGVADGDRKPQLIIAPNPCDEHVAITGAPNARSEMLIYDIGSRLVQRDVFSGNTVLGTASLNPGIYFYMVQSGARIIAQGRLVKR